MERPTFQLSFLNPPIQHLEDFPVFSLPKVKTSTLTSEKKPEKTLAEKYAWHEHYPTDGQRYRITRFCMALRINSLLEGSVSNEMEARDLIFGLRGSLKQANLERKAKKIKVTPRVSRVFRPPICY